MRDYAKVSPAFWMKGSGKALRGHAEAQIVGLYLVTCPSANMIGLYYLPKALLVHETGLTIEGATEGLRRASEVGFAFYDEESELVWVPNGATYQIGDTLTGKDKRKEGVLRELSVFRKHPFAREFFDLYRVPYGLNEPEWLLPRADAPSKPLRSQEQDHAQDHEQERERPAPPVRAVESGIRTSLPSDFVLTPERESYASMLALVDVPAIFLKFQNVCRETAKTSADWDATWKNFCGREVPIQRKERERGRPSLASASAPSPSRSPASNPIEPIRRPTREPASG